MGRRLLDWRLWHREQEIPNNLPREGMDVSGVELVRNAADSIRLRRLHQVCEALFFNNGPWPGRTGQADSE